MNFENPEAVSLNKENFLNASVSVAVCGLGGLGSNVAVMLARAGVGKLHLMDFDKVEMSNLNRQYFAMEHVGMLKADALKEIIAGIAPNCHVTAQSIKITEENIKELLKNDYIICEAFDEANQKAMLVNSVLTDFPDKYLVSASGMAGTGSSNDIKTRRVADRFFLCGDEVSDMDDNPLMISSRVMLCAAHEANMIIRILVGKAEV
ncbi:MAG: sulfur carrier protein ThiS adenylyltransferase ThiF [Lachnospira sp.]